MDLTSRGSSGEVRSAIMDLTSPDDPREMAMKESSSFVVERSNPSAMLFETESEALSNWFLKPWVSGTFGSSSRSSTALYSRAASCQTGSSSNCLYLAIGFLGGLRFDFFQR